MTQYGATAEGRWAGVWDLAVAFETGDRFEVLARYITAVARVTGEDTALTPGVVVGVPTAGLE